MNREIFSFRKPLCFILQSNVIFKYKVRNGFKKFSTLHSSKAETVISSYCSKKKRSSGKQSGYVYLKDSRAADSIASHITKDWKGRYILEANPGPGILTSSILKSENCHLRVFEKNKDFLEPLEILCSLYSNLEIVQEDLLCLPSLASRTSHNPSLLEEFYRNLPKYSWNEDVPYRVFSIIASKQSIKFLRYLLAVLPKRSSVFAFGRCEFFLLTKETEYMYMQAEPKENFSTYRWSTVLYNLFFDLEFLGKYSSESLFPKTKSRKKKHAGNNFYLIKLTPRSDLFSGFVTEDKLEDFYFFVRHHLVKRSSLVIPAFEDWIPLCGPRLIKEGMSVFRKFGDLSPEQLLLLFNQFSSWPEYKDSAFQAAVHRYLGKELTYEDDEEKEEEEDNN